MDPPTGYLGAGGTWGQGLLQLLGLLLVGDDQRVEVAAAAHLELHIVLVLLDLDGCGIGERVSGTAPPPPAAHKVIYLFSIHKSRQRNAFSVDQTFHNPLQLSPISPSSSSPICTAQNPTPRNFPTPQGTELVSSHRAQPPWRLPEGSLRPAAPKIYRVSNFQQSTAAHTGLISSCRVYFLLPSHVPMHLLDFSHLLYGCLGAFIQKTHSEFGAVPPPSRCRARCFRYRSRCRI